MSDENGRDGKVFCALGAIREWNGSVRGWKCRNVTQNLHFLHELEYIVHFRSPSKRP